MASGGSEDMVAVTQYLGGEERMPPSPRRGRRNKGKAAAEHDDIPLDEISPASPVPAAAAAAPNKKPQTYQEFAQRFFQDKSPSSIKYQRTPLPGPLLHQIWGDGDSDRVLSVWVMILRFLGDLPPSPERQLGNLQLVQVICQVGISRPNTRDEIYCQLCKQLTDNPNKTSHARAWILMALLAGSFRPKPAFFAVLKKFIEKGPPLYAPYILNKFERASAMGLRRRPLTAMEMFSAFTAKPIPIAVHFYSGKHVVEADSFTTAAEAVLDIIDKTDVQPEAGFVLCICSKDLEQMTPLHGHLHVLDAIYEFEQLYEEQAEEDPDWQEIVDVHPWTALYRKEFFAPWWEGEANIDLIYRQIIDGLMRGFYRCDEPDALALLIAQRYYIEFGKNLDRKSLIKMIEDEPLAGMGSASAEEWADKALMHFFLREYHKETDSVADAKVDVVQFARRNWFMEFSRRFGDIEVTSGGKTCEEALCLLNCRGIFVVGIEDGQPDLQFEIPFQQLVSVGEAEAVDPEDPESDWAFSLTMVINGGVVFSFKGIEAGKLQKIIDFNYQGLRDRSHYAVATSAQQPENEDMLTVEKGDLLRIIPAWGLVRDQEWVECVREADRKLGIVRQSALHILPIGTRPEMAYQAVFNEFFA